MNKDSLLFIRNKGAYAALAIIFFLLLGCGNFSGSSTQTSGVLGTGDGNLTLKWDPPNTNSDGSQATNVRGYKLYYGQTPGSYDYVVDIGTETAYTFNGLFSGNWCFTVSAYNSSGAESTYSNEVCTIV